MNILLWVFGISLTIVLLSWLLDVLLPRHGILLLGVQWFLPIVAVTILALLTTIISGLWIVALFAYRSL